MLFGGIVFIPPGEHHTGMLPWKCVGLSLHLSLIRMFLETVAKGVWKAPLISKSPNISNVSKKCPLWQLASRKVTHNVTFINQQNNCCELSTIWTLSGRFNLRSGRLIGRPRERKKTQRVRQTGRTRDKDQICRWRTSRGETEKRD